MRKARRGGRAAAAAGARAPAGLRGPPRCAGASWGRRRPFLVFLVYLFSSNLPGRLAVFYKYCAAFRSRSRHVLGCFRGSAAPPRALGVRVGAGFVFRVVFGFLVYLFSCNLPARLVVFYKYGAIFRDRPRHVLGCFRGSAAPPRFWGCGWGLDFRLLPPQSGLPHWLLCIHIAHFLETAPGMF